MEQLRKSLGRLEKLTTDAPTPANAPASSAVSSSGAQAVVHRPWGRHVSGRDAAPPTPPTGEAVCMRGAHDAREAAASSHCVVRVRRLGGLSLLGRTEAQEGLMGGACRGAWVFCRLWIQATPSRSASGLLRLSRAAGGCAGATTVSFSHGSASVNSHKLGSTVTWSDTPGTTAQGMTPAQGAVNEPLPIHITRDGLPTTAAAAAAPH
jgi:hypothetical protein